MYRPRKAVFTVLAIVTANVSFGADFQPGEVIVKYRDGSFRARTEMRSIYSSVGVKKVRHYSNVMNGIEHLILQDDVRVEDAISKLSKNKLVAYAQPNYILKALPIAYRDNELTVSGNLRPQEDCWFPGVPFPPGCGDDSPGGGGGDDGGTGGSKPDLKAPPAEVSPPVADPNISKAYGLEKISAPAAWKIHRGDKNFIVADIDTGIDYNHEDLAFNLWRNPNPSDKNDVVGFDFVHNDGLPFDDNEHGTHTAGTIAAVGENGIGISGVIQRVSLMSLKFLSGKGEGTTADAIRAIDYAVEHGAKILSNSWGGPEDAENQALKDAVERARLKDVLFVAAAGNESVDNDKTPSYPAAFDNDNMISVAATDQSDGMAYFSNYGLKTTHLGAPGANIYSTVPGNKYRSLSGTSMACPHVAGAAALVWSMHPDWKYTQVKQALMQTVDPLPALQGKTVTGGRINVLKALQWTEQDDRGLDNDE
jgi:subtilisin family serine protease